MESLLLLFTLLVWFMAIMCEIQYRLNVRHGFGGTPTTASFRKSTALSRRQPINRTKQSLFVDA
jgi:hypothetical protein